MKPLALTDNQMRLIRHAAASLRPDLRDGFLQTVAAHLTATPSDHAVQAAVNIALGRMPVSVFMCDSATKRGERR
jgi:hypothetical protein